MEALVSVVVTTCRRNIEILNEAMESILNQTYQNIEVILVDDNGIGNDFQKKNESAYATIERVVYIVNKENSGAQFSRNIGILHSHGEYIAFLDDDDIWHPQKIEKQIKAFSENVGMVFCQGVTFKGRDFSKGKPYHVVDDFMDYINYSDMLYRDRVGSTSQAIIKRATFAKTGLFDYDMPARQDYEMWLRISKYFRITWVDEALFYHRIHDGAQISKNHEKAISAYKLILLKYREDYNKNTKAKAKLLCRISVTELFDKRIAHAVKYLLLAFFANPCETINTIMHNHAI